MIDRRIHDKIMAMWDAWYKAKDNADPLEFRDWIKAEYGFTYIGIYDQKDHIAIVDKVYDHKKYSWFLLQC